MGAVEVILKNFPNASHIDPPANGQAVFFLTGLLEVFVVYF